MGSMIQEQVDLWSVLRQNECVTCSAVLVLSGDYERELPAVVVKLTNRWIASDQYVSIFESQTPADRCRSSVKRVRAALGNQEFCGDGSD